MFLSFSFFHIIFRNRILTNQKHELVVSNCQRKCMNIWKFQCELYDKFFSKKTKAEALKMIVFYMSLLFFDQGRKSESLEERGNIM